MTSGVIPPLHTRAYPAQCKTRTYRRAGYPRYWVNPFDTFLIICVHIVGIGALDQPAERRVIARDRQQEQTAVPEQGN